MFRKFTDPLLLVCWMVLSACAPALTPVPATATPTLTLEPTRTPTPELPSLPPEYLSALPANYRIVDKQVMVNDQAWFELNAEKQWQKTDWKLFEDADMQMSWQPEKDWRREGADIGMYAWPIVTGEPAVEKQMVLNG